MSPRLPPLRLSGSSPPARGPRPRAKRKEHRISHKAEVRDSLKALGAQLSAFRKKNSLSQRDMAAKAGCSWQIISHLECVTGDAPSYAVLLALRKAMGLPAL